MKAQINWYLSLCVSMYSYVCVRMCVSMVMCVCVGTCACVWGSEVNISVILQECAPYSLRQGLSLA